MKKILSGLVLMSSISAFAQDSELLEAYRKINQLNSQIVRLTQPKSLDTLCFEKVSECQKEAGHLQRQGNSSVIINGTCKYEQSLEYKTSSVCYGSPWVLTPTVQLILEE
jgi:hypothetical protein